jgi:hypothetical protein
MTKAFRDQSGKEDIRELVTMNLKHREEVSEKFAVWPMK